MLYQGDAVNEGFKDFKEIQDRDPRKGLAEQVLMPCSRTDQSRSRRQTGRVEPSDGGSALYIFAAMCSRSERLYGTFTKQLRHRRLQLVVLRAAAWLLWL